MAVTFDGVNKRIVASPGTVTLDVRDVYSRWKDWIVLSGNEKWLQAFRVAGGDPIGGGNYVSSYFFLLNGWRIRPQEANHTLTVTGSVVVDGGGDAFVATLGSFRVLVVQAVPVKAETVDTGGGGGTCDLTAVEAQLNLVLADLVVLKNKSGGGIPHI